MPSVNQCWGVMHGQLQNINCFHLTLLLWRVRLYMYAPACGICIRRHIHLHHPHWLRLMCPSSLGGPWRPLANRAELDVWLSCTDEPEEKCITSLIDWLCVCILWVQTPPPPHHAIDLAFNAQTNSSLVIPGYFLGPLLSQHNLLKGEKKQCEMSWRKNFICSINLESGSFLSNETVDELFASGLWK